jgi:hypothetical protein
MKRKISFIIVLFVFTNAFLYGQIRQTHQLIKGENHIRLNSPALLHKPEFAVKSATAKKFLLKGFTGENWITEYEYDLSENLTLEKSYIWEDGQFVPDYKTIFEYDLSGNLIKEIEYRGRNGEFVLYEKNEYIYDNGFKTQSDNFRFEYQIWEHVSRVIYTYDSNGRLKMEQFSHKGYDEVFADRYQRVYSYDDNNNIALTISSEFYDDQWFELDKTEYLRENNILIELRNYQMYGTEWVLANKTDFTYSGGLLTEEISTSDEKNSFRKIYQYDEFENLIDESAYNWSDDRWIGRMRVTSVWDHMGNLVEACYFFDWDDDTDTWIPEMKYAYKLDLDVRLEELILPQLFTFWNHKPIEFTIFNWEDGEWHENHVFNFNYEDLNVSSIFPTPKPLVVIFPNPVSDVLTLQMEMKMMSIFELYDLQGRKLHSEKFNDDISISLDHLKAGVYIYRISQGTETSTGKITKK